MFDNNLDMGRYFDSHFQVGNNHLTTNHFFQNTPKNAASSWAWRKPKIPHIHNSSHCCDSLCFSLFSLAVVNTHTLQYAHWHSATSSTIENTVTASCIQSLFVPVHWREYVCAHEPLSQHHLMAVTHKNSTVNSQTLTSGIAVVANKPTAWKGKHKNYLTEHEEEAWGRRREMSSECLNDRGILGG